MESATSFDFSSLKAVAKMARDPEQQANARDTLIRCLGSDLPDSYKPILNSLCMAVGLYPYVERTGEVPDDTALTLELNRRDIGGSHSVIMHPEQSVLFQRLISGESIILSAPTSFGKSTLIDALLATRVWNNVLIVVPTIALMDEARRRLAKFSEDYKVITHGSQEPSEKNVYVLTQERVLSMPVLPPLDLFVIDEFYKLSPETDTAEERMVQLNVTWARLRKTGAQYFLAGPFVDGLSLSTDHVLHEGFVRSSFRTVAVDIDDRSSIEDPESDLQALLQERSLEGTLVFVRSPAQAAKISKAVRGYATNFAERVSAWIGLNYDAEWYPVRALRRGVGVHVGPLPRSLQRAMLRLFDNGDISALICTSTLLEGVNTSAKNVVIFDKKLTGNQLNSFTFFNAAGRAGRMMRHHVGRVITYAEIPVNSGPLLVDIPIESQSPNSSAATLIHIEDEALSDDSRATLENVLTDDTLPKEILRRHAGVRPERQIAAADSLRNLSSNKKSRLEWTGYPNADQLRATVTFAFQHLTEPGDRRGMNANMLLGRLNTVRMSAGDLRSVVDTQQNYAREGQSRDDIVDDVIKFERNWLQHRLPKLIRTLQSVQNHDADIAGRPRANYELFAREIEAAYQSETAIDLEELGLPVPLSKRLQRFGLSGRSRDERLANLKLISAKESVRSQLDAIDLWFIDDVVAGV